MIITCKTQVPFRWIFFAMLPWAAFTLNYDVMGVGFLFSLKKFVDNPAGLTFVLSLPGIISIFSVPISNFLSDRIWTRFGRRKPFIASGFAGIVVCMTLMPLMPNFWALVAVYAAYGLFNDMGGATGPMEPLSQEIVPPQQRGRASGTMQWCGNLVNMSFYFLALGRFDDVRFMAGVPLGGEKVLYWMAGLLMAIVLLFVMLGIKEIDPKSELRGQRLSLKTFFAGVLDRELWPVFTLVFSSAMLNAGLGALGTLLYTDQWGYTKQEMGTNVVVGSVINMFVIGFLAVIADRLDRMRAYQVLICVALAVKAAFYIYVKWVLPDGRPSLVEIIVFGECLSMVAILTNMIYTPLVYDYVTRNKMGTYMAGASVVTRVTQLITLNGVGLFLWGYAVLFQPPAGDMVRITLRGGEMPKSEIDSVIHGASWTYPQTDRPVPASAVRVAPWYATGMKLESGRCWEIRLADKDSEELEEEADHLKKESDPLASREGLLSEHAVVLRGESNPVEAATEDWKAEAVKTRVDELDGQIDEVNSKLAARSGDFQKQVTRIFGDRILVDGEQVLGAERREALLLELPTAKLPEGFRFEQILADLRSEMPAVIDLRPTKRDAGYGVTISMLLPAGTDEKNAAHDLQATLERVAARRNPGFLVPGASVLGHERQPALVMSLMIIEEPLDTRISPIMRVVNFVLGLFGNGPVPEHRLTAIGRNLRVSGEIDHVRVDPGANHDKSITVIAVIRPEAARSGSVDDAVGNRLKSLLGNGAPGSIALAQVRAFYDRVEESASSQHLTVARPFVDVAYAPVKYDYMSGYIWMFLMGLLGFAITVAFKRREAKGLIHKRGVEEAQRSMGDLQKLEEKSPSRIEEDSPVPGRYIPGHALRKFAMILFGLALVTFGISQLWSPLRLFCVGGRETAEATQVIKTKPGFPDQFLTNDVEIRGKQEKSDRSYVFWNEFRFRTADGREVVVRSPIGSLSKPLYPLFDENGLPTRVRVWYDFQRPEVVAFPALFSTWFAPGVLVFLGVACATIGAFLFYWAGKPIELPGMAAARIREPSCLAQRI